MTIALSKSCNAPETISLAEADFLFIRIAIGIDESIMGDLRDFHNLFDLFVLPLCSNNISPRSVKLSNILIAAFNSPPEFPLRSIIKPSKFFSERFRKPSLKSLSEFFENLVIYYLIDWILLFKII